MFDTIGRVAEKAALRVSRRAFLGQVGRGAAVVAGALGGLLASTSTAIGAGRLKCCVHSSDGGGYLVQCQLKGKGPCPWGWTQILCSDQLSCPQS